MFVFAFDKQVNLLQQLLWLTCT